MCQQLCIVLFMNYCMLKCFNVDSSKISQWAKTDPNKNLIKSESTAVVTVPTNSCGQITT